MVDNLFLKTKPQCIGIYRIDIPETFNNVKNIATYDDFKIESKFIYRPAFEQRIARREQELHNAINMPGNEAENGPFIKEIIRLPDNRGVIFDRNHNGSDDAYRMLEAHIYSDHIAFIITVKFRDLSTPKYSDERKSYLDAGFTEIELNEKPTKLAALRSLISRLNGRLDDEIPTEKGVCIPNGFISGDSSLHKVVAGLYYENADFSFGINTDNSLLADGDTFFGRSDNINSALKGSSMETLQKYAKIQNSIPLEAWLFKGIKNYNERQLQVYDFSLYANEAAATASRPLVTLDLNSRYKQTRYSEAQMVDIWDRVVGSLRYKPNAF